MILPKIQWPTFTCDLPVAKKTIKIRPMLQKDEKILLMAKEGEDPTEILAAIKQIVNNCLLEDVNVNQLAIIDLEWLFVRLMSVSISNTTKVSYIDGEDKQTREFEINLDQINITEGPSLNNIIVNNEIYVTLKYPIAGLYSNKEFLTAVGEEAVVNMVVAVIDNIYHNDKPTLTSQTSINEIKEFVGTLPISVYNQFKEYISGLPHLNYEIKYKNSLDHDRQILLTSLNDFFMLA